MRPLNLGKGAETASSSLFNQATPEQPDRRHARWRSAAEALHHALLVVLAVCNGCLLLLVVVCCLLLAAVFCWAAELRLVAEADAAAATACHIQACCGSPSWTSAARSAAAESARLPADQTSRCLSCCCLTVAASSHHQAARPLGVSALAGPRCIVLSCSAHALSLSLVMGCRGEKTHREAP